MSDELENPDDLSTLDAEIILKQQDLEKILQQMEAMKKSMKQARKERRKNQRLLKQTKAELNYSRKKTWQLILNNSKNQKDIALAGLAGGLNQN